jgi:photosystem II stability/assembly factor-like uncharacterized protein
VSIVITVGAKEASMPVGLFVATRKGAWILESDSARRRWETKGPIFLGHVIHHLVLDPRDRRTALMAARTGHLGPTVFRSTDAGASWQEASKPPAFPKEIEGVGRVVDHVFWLEPGHASEPGVWYAGTSPEGLFRSEDAGQSWEIVQGFRKHPAGIEWAVIDPKQTTPDGPIVHSITIDPRDARHIYVGISGHDGGVFETTDQGRSWKALNRGSLALFLPEPDPEYGQDPHCLRLHPLAPDVLYQQSHCGIYRIERPATRWERIGENMPKEVGDIGFPIVLHPRDPRTAWVFPMDGTDVWPRTSPDGRPAAYVTRDAGKSWQRQDRGLPSSQAWLTVRRQAMTADAHDPVGVYFGTTNGDVWGSTDEGAHWSEIARHLPMINAVVAGELAT